MASSEPTEGLRERYAESATRWALMYPLANWPWPGRTLAGADAEHLDAIARDIAAAWGADIADRMLAVRDEDRERVEFSRRANLDAAAAVIERAEQAERELAEWRDAARAEADLADESKTALAEARAAIERVRRAIASFEWTVVGKLVSAALDAPQRPEDAPTDRPKLITGNGVKRRPSEELTPIYEDVDP